MSTDTRARLTALLHTLNGLRDAAEVMRAELADLRTEEVAE